MWWVECRSLDHFEASREGYVPVYGPFSKQSEAQEWRAWVDNFLCGPTCRVTYRSDLAHNGLTPLDSPVDSR